MAEIIFDEAPGLNKLMFASGTNSARSTRRTRSTSSPPMAPT